eukprot:Sro867_g213180.2  (439) ;mRNA; r:19783-21099
MNLHRRRRKASTKIQRLVRKKRQANRVRAAIQIQRMWRSQCSRHILTGKNALQAFPQTFNAQLRICSALYLGCFACVVVGSTREIWLRALTDTTRSAAVACQIAGIRSVFKQLRAKQEAAHRRHTQAIIALQRSFRRKRALAKWKTKLGIGDSEKKFREGIEIVEDLLGKLKLQSNDDVVSLGQGSDNNSTGSDLSPVLVDSDAWQGVVEEWKEYAARNIQRKWRSKRNKAKATISIQSRCRRFLNRTHYLKCCSAAVSIQSRYRSFVGRKRYLAARAAALAIQEFLWTHFFAAKRAQLIKETLKELVDRRHEILCSVSSVVLQRWWRLVLARKLYQAMKKYGAGIRLLRSIQERNSASRIQRWWRLWRARTRALLSMSGSLSYSDSFSASSVIESSVQIAFTTSAVEHTGDGDVDGGRTLKPGKKTWCGFEVFLSPS